jgi:hypothetical protein
MLKDFEIVKNENTPWVCYKDPESSLVYFVHAKCACSFYQTLFCNRLNWKLCTVNDINWDVDLVFSYIRNPLVKQRIGIIEWFYFNNCEYLLEQNYEDDKFFKLLSEIGYIDHHSLSIYEHLGNKSRRVHWIPIDQPNVDHKQKTLDLIKQHSTIDSNLELWFLAQPPVHVSSGFKKSCNERLIKLPTHPMIIKSIEYDQTLYDSVTKPYGFEPDNFQDRVKQLLDLELSQCDAELIADQEVASGKYLNWITTS